MIILSEMRWAILGVGFQSAFALDNRGMLYFSRVLLGVLILLGMGSAHAQNGLPPPMLKALQKAGVGSGSVAVVLRALPKEGENLAAPEIAHRADVSMNPASVMKLVTTYAALDQLGADFTWKNRVYTDGKIEDGVLFGNLILRGSGDPKLVLERIEDLFKQVQTKGVREIRGDLILVRRVFDVPDKNPADFDDEPLRPYNAVPDGLLVNFKSLIFTFTPDPAYQRIVIKSEPPMVKIEIPAQVQASEGSCGDWRSNLKADFSNPNRISFAGKYSLNCGEKIWPVAYVAPREYAKRVLEAMWLASGGLLTGVVREEAAPKNARLLLVHESLPLSYIAADVNKFSNNVMAQQVFLTLSAQGKQGSFAASQKNMAAWWNKTLPDAAPPVLENGSGLSRKERASAASLQSLLLHAANSKNAQVFADSMGIAGVDGTVARMKDRNAHSPVIGQAQLKTGTLRDVAAIAGYVNAASGKRYALVAIINHPSAGAARPALDALTEWVVTQK